MLSFPPSVRVFIATQPIDGRKGADGLVALIRSAFQHDPLDGHLHVFFSKRADRVRVIYWDRSGFALWSKRLERGRFHAEFTADGSFTTRAIDGADLAPILDGLDLAEARRRPRWAPTRPTNAAIDTTHATY